jgi:hypothetical protein
MKGECFTCANTPICRETSVERVLKDYTCYNFKPVPEPVYLARLRIRWQFGDEMSAEAILNRGPELQGGENDDAISGRV